MLRGLALALLLCSAAHADSLSAAAPAVPSVMSFSQLPSGVPAGTLSYVTDCRAILSVTSLALVTQAAGTGTGCLASFNGSVWQIDGTAIPVTR